MYKVLKSINKHYFPKKYLFTPEWIVLGVNNVCNLHCKMCDVGTKNLESNFAQNLVGTHPINMPIELIKNIINQVKKNYPKAKLGYAFTEPLVYPHLIESLAYANKKGLYTTITTNALTLKHKAEQLVDVGINEVYISLDGPKDIHNEIRGHKKSFQKALEGIEELIKINSKQSISVFCVITEWNIGYLTEFLNEIKHLPLKEVGFMHTNFTPEYVAQSHNEKWSQHYLATSSNMDEINIDNFNLDTLLKEIKKIKTTKLNFNVSFSPDISTKEGLDVFYHKPQEIIGKGCNDVFGNIMIKSDGSVIPAHGRCYNLELGNMYKESLKEVWNSKVLKKLRNDLNESGGLFPACSRCCSAF
ncbi:radical SAM protein [Tenacibaculum ovolyticum]|uniref:radical SAM protein n=1 Tax=Tenacibaculum ovolyticum TaxID=104270 RepID=UPI000402C776|nr:radical SAM protein [Tenacibaculum ovolyticum]